jgi:small subunit ribosomal protein S17
MANKAQVMNDVAKETTKPLRTVQGRVVSNKMDKTVTILVERLVKHALYGKYIRRSTKLHAHDADNVCNPGDVVRVSECRPLSKTKNWRVVEIVARAAE